MDETIKWLGMLLIGLVFFWYLTGGYTRSKNQNNPILAPQKNAPEQIFYNVYGPSNNPVKPPVQQTEPVYILR